MPRIVQQVKFPPVVPKRIRVAAYARVSTGKEAMLHSLASQVEYYSHYIRSTPGWEYAGVYADEAKTGTKDSRENFQRMLTDCRAGKIDHILSKSISRFARNTVTLLETVRELKALGISVYFEEQNIDTSTADGELMLSILASYAQEESLSTSENMKWRIRSNFQQGLAWNPTLLGYRYEEGVFVIQPEEAEIVRQIYDRYLDGMGATAIAKLLNESGKVSRFGNAWGQRSIMLILQNDSYTGNLLLQKTFSENHLTKKKKYNEGQLPMYHIQNSHEAIIPLEKYNAVQAEIKRRAEKYAKPHRNKGNYLFSGLLVCGICGKHYRRKETAAGAVWICPTYNSMGKAACSSKRIPESTLLEVTKKTLGSLEALTGKITAVRAENGNRLVFCFPDGTESVKRWQDRSRADSWTEEMRAVAAEKTRERGRNHNG